jgi:hypothetical protein
LNVSLEDRALIEDSFRLEDVGGAAARREILQGVWKDRVLPELKR